MKNASATSSMSPRFCVLTMVVVMLVLTRPSLVHSRALLLGAKSEIGRLTIESVDRASFSKTSADSSRRTIVRDKVFQLSSGPSGKGTGH